MARKESNKIPKELAAITEPASVGYFARTCRPVYALVFLLPFIIIYEILVFAVNPQLLSEPINNVRGGVVAFVWIQNFLHHLGLDAKSAWLCAPLVIIITLLALQFTSRQKWKMHWPDLLIMACECILISLPLIILSPIFKRLNEPPLLAAVELHHHSFVMDIITGIGAGIYEELVFRLVLIGLLMLFFETILGVKRTKAIFISVIASAVLFSLHHHFVFINGRFAQAEPFTKPLFIFRTIAGIYFASVFAIRGFGIVAGAHIFYDILAAILNTWLFNHG
ncbi:MAG: hypothetical protein CVV39_05890 [Planctomycetes bacterium HGW-Planctomycetes-1]|nr:MAG: hypothetical protein CVV39_05890 [Planctomycetes bacterium HGW-Planctomycetes-1]